MADEAGEKTEEATQARREEFRNRGQVAHTRELASALLLLAAFAGIYSLGRFFFQQVFEVFDRSFGADMVQAVRTGQFYVLLQMAAGKTMYMLLPVLLIVGILGVMSAVLQVGILQVEDALTPKLDKLDPLQGLKRIFSMRALVEGLKALLKVSVVILIVYLILKSEMATFPHLMTYSLEDILKYMGSISGRLLGIIGIFMAVVATADYFFQRWDLEKQMMMTKQEVKEEHKSREGDPLIKSRIRRMQRDMANRRMMQDVPKADVIITNPTHIAVALKYDANLPAPQVIAKGGDLVAEKIKEIAKQNRIPIVENKPLARTIFKTLKIGQVIPRELFVAVAEVLSYVYKLKRKARA